MSKARRLFATVLLLSSLLAPEARGEEAIVVGTKEAPPFSMKTEDGRWEGITIELVDRVARELGETPRYVETTLEGLLTGVEEGRFDVAAAALTVTAEREERIDFSHPYHTSGLGIAVPKPGEAGLGEVVGRIVSSRFLLAVLALVGVLFLAGIFLWMFERRSNPEQFGGSPAKGLGSAFWWSAVTMTTVGYGDKAPVSIGGRLIAVMWMFAGVILIAGFTGAIASALTVSGLQTAVQGPEDLPGVLVGTVRDSTSEAYLRQRNLRRRAYGDLHEALEALARHQVGAVVYDRPLLAWAVRQDPALDKDLVVLPRIFERQDYALALPQGSDRREAVNRVIVRLIKEPWWNEVLQRYTG